MERNDWNGERKSRDEDRRCENELKRLDTQKEPECKCCEEAKWTVRSHDQQSTSRSPLKRRASARFDYTMRRTVGWNCFGAKPPNFNNGDFQVKPTTIGSCHRRLTRLESIAIVWQPVGAMKL